MIGSEYKEGTGDCCIHIQDFVSRVLPGFKVIGGQFPNGKQIVVGKEKHDGEKHDESPDPDL